MSSADKAKSVVQAYLEGWRSGDKDAWLALFAEDAAIIDPVATPENRGLDAIGALWDRVTGTGMKMAPELHKVVVCGNEVLASFTMVSTTGGMGMAVDIVDIFTLNDDGKITLLKAYWDNSCTRMVTAS